MINPTINRFYWLNLEQDLFGEWCLRTISGHLNNKYKRERTLHYPDQLTASQALSLVELKHRQQGYTYANLTNIDFFALTPQTIAEI